MNDELKKLQEPDGSCETCEHFRDSGQEYCGCCNTTPGSASNRYTETMSAFDDRMEKIRILEGRPTYNQLLHEYNTTRGLFCIDRSPEIVSLAWIRKNAFELKDIEI